MARRDVARLGVARPGAAGQGKAGTARQAGQTSALIILYNIYYPIDDWDTT